MFDIFSKSCVAFNCVFSFFFFFHRYDRFLRVDLLLHTISLCIGSGQCKRSLKKEIINEYCNAFFVLFCNKWFYS